jgi:hypothetical protein
VSRPAHEALQMPDAAVPVSGSGWPAARQLGRGRHQSTWHRSGVVVCIFVVQVAIRQRLQSSCPSPSSDELVEFVHLRG